MTGEPLPIHMLEEAADWHSHTAWQGDVNPGQLKLEVDVLAERELEEGAGPVSGAAESPRSGPPASGGAAPKLPHVEIRTLVNGTFRVVYVAMSGSEHVVGKYDSGGRASIAAKAYAKVHGCQIEAPSC